MSALVLHGKGALDDALGGQLLHCGPLTDPVHLSYREQDEGGHQETVDASFGGSLLKNNMDVEAAMEMQRHLDETGFSLHHLCMSYLWVCTMFAHGLLGLH